MTFASFHKRNNLKRFEALLNVILLILLPIKCACVSAFVLKCAAVGYSCIMLFYLYYLLIFILFNLAVVLHVG